MKKAAPMMNCFLHRQTRTKNATIESFTANVAGNSIEIKGILDQTYHWHRHFLFLEINLCLTFKHVSHQISSESITSACILYSVSFLGRSCCLYKYSVSICIIGCIGRDFTNDKGDVLCCPLVREKVRPCQWKTFYRLFSSGAWWTQ